MRYEMQQRQMQAAGGEDLGNALMRHGATKAAPSFGLWTPDGAAPSPPRVNREVVAASFGCLANSLKSNVFRGSELACEVG